jgi:hypothetical protein
MRKLLLIPLLFLLLVACGASEEAEPAGEAPEDNSGPADVAESEVENEAPSVSADSISPAETVAEAGVIRDRDWTKGAEDPLITIIEYGDFQ